jgi:type II secretory pathway component PulJ
MNLKLWENGLDQFIELPHGGPGAGFPLSALADHIRSTGRDYIIQGQQRCTLAEHTKLNSLDYWLRQNCTERKDTRQAVNQVLDTLVATGHFEVARGLLCPDSGRRCKGLRLVKT